MTLRRQLPTWSRTTIAALGAFVLPLSLSGVASAEEDSATEIAAARSLAVDGLKLAQAGKCDEAIPKLERSEKLHHSPIVLSQLGECQVNGGKLVEGTEMLRKVLREPLPPNPSPALSKAYVRAQTVLDAAKPKIAGLTVSIAIPQGADLKLTVDGLVVANTLVDTELPADPGDHVVEATAPGYLKATTRVTLGTADKKTVTLKLEADPNAPAPTPVSPGPEANPAPAAPAAPAKAVLEPSTLPEPARKSPSKAPAYAAWSVGAIGIGVGTAFGVMAMKAKHDLDGQCQGTQCPPSTSGDVDSAKLKGNISTVAFAVGGAGVVLGTVLYFSIGGSSSAHGSAPARSFAGLQRGRAMIGPGSVQLAADF